MKSTKKWKSWNTLDKKLNLNYYSQEWTEIKRAETYYLVGTKQTQVCSLRGGRRMIGSVEVETIEYTNLIIYN